LNGAVLGMKKAEIDYKFDEIVAFAELESFIDTPVKHYSSGMYMRLAFSVAAHLEPEILVVDEVLAVGDTSFQKKCIGKLEEVGSKGRTVLFVSHNVPIVLRLCSRVILLNRGRLAADGMAQTVTRSYLQSETNSPAERMWPDGPGAPGDSVARLRRARVLDGQGRVADSLDIRSPIFIEVEYQNLQSVLRPTAILHLINQDGVCLFATNEFNNPAWKERPLKSGLVRATCRIPGNFLAEGTIYVLVAVGSYNPNVLHAIEREAISFQVIDRSEADGARGIFSGEWPGVLRPLLEWDVEYDC
jgi:lipopolysaccharide transport system ATP-binding protein